MPSPAIISRSSCRAVMWPMPTSPSCCEVEQGQALGEQLAVDDALAKAGDDPEADAAGEFVERGADAAEVVAFDMLKAVAQNDPVDALAGVLGALRAAVPDQLGVEARACVTL